MKRRDVLIGLALALGVALFLSPLASDRPDGLERVASVLGFLDRGEGKHPVPSPLPDYRFPGLENEKLAASVSGALGALILFGLGCGIAALIRPRKRDDETRLR